jgi:hypothetical protein
MRPDGGSMFAPCRISAVAERMSLAASQANAECTPTAA